MDLVTFTFSDFEFVALVYFLVLMLAHLLPAPIVPGYIANESGEPLKYKLVGFRVYVVFMVGYLLSIYYEKAKGNLFANRIWELGQAANVLGLAASLGFYLYGWFLPANRQDRALRARTVEQKGDEDVLHKCTQQPNFFVDFYKGLKFNPQVFGLDVKLCLYLIGAITLQLIIISVSLQHYRMFGHLSNAMIVYVGCFSFFVMEYIYHEHVHLYTYDFFAEKVGFKLVWGCFCFYPFVYPVGIWPFLSSSQNDISTFTAIGIAILFFVGWVLTRGANNQKYAFKINPSAKFLGLVEQTTIPGTRILISGWWGLARHVNYFGEIIQSVALALPAYLATGSLHPFIYVLYYLVLLIPRQIDDDALCAAKYGDAWKEYTRKVPYRIVPYLW